MAKGNFKYDDVFDDNKKQEIIDDYVKNELSLRDIREKYSINSNSWIEKLLKPYRRSISESGKIAHKKKPNCFKHREETKAKLRNARLKYMKEHPENTAWRRANISYPEKMFMKFLEEKGYSSKYLIHREYSVFPYFIDFAFVEQKIAIEIDGSQHLLPERKAHDEKKDALLVEQGWKVIRIAENIVKTDWDLIQNTLSQYLTIENIETTTKVGVVKEVKHPQSSNQHKIKIPKIKKVGIVKAPKKTEKPVREANGKTKKQNEQIAWQRSLSKRPSDEDLEKMIQEYTATQIGKMLGVTETAVRNWCKKAGLPFRRRDIKQKYFNQEYIPLQIVKCDYCGKEFKQEERTSRFCCKECYKNYIAEHGSLERNHNYSNLQQVTKEKILELKDKGFSFSKTAKELNISRNALEWRCNYHKISIWKRS